MYKDFQTSTDPLFWRRSFEALKTSVEAQVWHPFQNWYSSRSQQYHRCIFRSSVYRLNTVCNTSSYTSWIPVAKTGLQHVHGDLKTLTDPSFWRHIVKALKTSFLYVLQPKFNVPGIQVVLSSTVVESLERPITITRLTLNRKWVYLTNHLPLYLCLKRKMIRG